LKFLIACALITAISQTAVAQTTPEMKEKCKQVHVRFELGEIPKYGDIPLYASIRNDDPYTLTFASFYFDLYIGENFKVGDGSASIRGRLIPGTTEKVRVFYRVDRDIKSDIENGAAIAVTSEVNSCSFSPNY
jgi:hypothetical protein